MMGAWVGWVRHDAVCCTNPRPGLLAMRLLARLVAAAVWSLLVGLAAAADALPVIAPAISPDFAAFQRDESPRIREVRPAFGAKHWRQIEPAVFALARAHADRLAALDDAERTATLAALADFIDRHRTTAAERPVLAAERRVIGLLDPARGLDPQEIETIATAYQARPTVFKQDPATGQSRADVAAAFLDAVREAAASQKPATVVVLGHGLPTEIQSYSIPVATLAAALMPEPAATATAADPTSVDLSQLVLICDDCFSADFLVNLLDSMTTTCRDRGLTLTSLPICIAGTSHGRYGHAAVGEKFVPHFWRDVIELFYVRLPRPETVTLSGFFNGVDSMMYGYGRVPVFEDGRVIDWRLVDPDLVQDPIVFLPLDAADLTELRRILGLPADAPLPRWLDAG
jgi:broad specificity phosphatase PhoE